MDPLVEFMLDSGGRGSERILTHLLFSDKALEPLSLADIPRTLRLPTNLGPLFQDKS